MNQMERTGLKSAVIEGIVRLADRYQLEKVILFGSRARGDHWRASDIDLAVLGGDVTGFAIDVEEEVPTLLTFDVVDLSRPVARELARSIQREGIVIYEKV